MEDTRDLQTDVNQIGDTYPTGAAALTFGEEQRGTLQNSPRGGPILPADQKKKRSNTLKTEVFNFLCAAYVPSSC